MHLKERAFWLVVQVIRLFFPASNLTSRRHRFKQDASPAATPVSISNEPCMDQISFVQNVKALAFEGIVFVIQANVYSQ